MTAVLGISEHNGWAEFVIVGVHEAEPVILARERVTLRDPGLPSQPYHHEALEMPLAEAETLVGKVREAVTRNTRAALEEARARHGVRAIALQHSPFDRLPDSLAEVLASWSLTCAADGMMYRETLADCAAGLGLDVIRYPRKSDPLRMAGEALGVEPERIASLVNGLAKPLGKPWRKEHRLAAAGALWALGRYAEVRI